MKNDLYTTNNVTIAIHGSSSKNDNKQKINIDNKLKKIEKLKKQLKKINTTIAIAQKLYVEYIKKEEDQLLETTKKLIFKLHERFTQKGFTVWQQELLKNKLLNEINFLVSKGSNSQEISKIQEEIISMEKEMMSDFEKEMMNEMAKEYLRDRGIKIDEDNFNFEDFTNPEFIEQFEKNQYEHYKQEYSNNYQNQEERKHIDQHQKVKNTDKDFQKLYKSLVKKAHPDLVIDPTQKEQREEWMKKLSSAWDQRNYYELLLLQKEIDTDSTTEISLNLSQLKPLIKQLNEEISKLEDEKYQLKHFNEDTAYYYETFNARSEKGILKKILAHKDSITHQINDIEKQYSGLKTKKSTKELLKEIREYTNSFSDNIFDFSFDEFDDNFSF